MVITYRDMNLILICAHLLCVCFYQSEWDAQPKQYNIIIVNIVSNAKLNILNNSYQYPKNRFSFKNND